MDSQSALSMFLSTPVGDHLPRSTTGDVPLRKKGPVMIVQRDETLPRVFRKLAAENFLGAPVLDGNRYVGQIDLMDLVKKTTNLFWGDSVEAWTTFWDKEDKFAETTVDDIMKVPNEWTRDPFPPLHSSFTTLYALEQLVRTGQHRIAVVSKLRKRVTGILTQSMLISWLRQNKDCLGALRDMKVSEMCSESKTPVQTIKETETAINGFKKMANMDVSGLAVVDDQGVLTGNLSVRDLRGVGTSGEQFYTLFRTVKEFKAIERQDYPRLAPPTHYSNKKVPLRGRFVTMNGTFDDVLNQMVDGNIHRIFVVENAARPIPTHVISQVDLLRHVLDWIVKDAARI